MKQLDLFLQKKDAFYQNKSYWTDEPMIHVLPHWNFDGRDGEIIDVWAYTNCACAELFLNGVSMGRVDVKYPGHAQWAVPYKPGELRAVGYRDGAAVCEDIAVTTGRAVALELELQNGDYLSAAAVIHCYAVDENGLRVPDASPFVSFYAGDGARIIGTGSDICDHVPPSCHDRRMRAGVIAVAVDCGNARSFTVYAEADGLRAASLTVCVRSEA